MISLADSQPVKNQPCFINNRGFTERYFSDKAHASLIDWWLRCVTKPVSFLEIYSGLN